MTCYVGLDIGAVSATAAVVAPADSSPGGETGFAHAADLPDGRGIWLSPYQRTKGRPLAAAAELLELITQHFPAGEIGVCMTGGAAHLAAEKLGAREINEFKAIAAGLSTLDVKARTVFEMGGEAAKYLRLAPAEGGYGIIDYATNGDCAAGTGSFIDQQAGRLQYRVEEIGDICLAADRSAQVAGRCSVFAKSDMIHAQQKGYSPAEVLRGLCEAVARNYRTAVVRSHPVESPVVLLGGLAANGAVVQALADAFELGDGQLHVPEHFTHVGAIGSAMVAAERQLRLGDQALDTLRRQSERQEGGFPTSPPLSMDNVLLLRDQVEPFRPAGRERIDAYMGIDIGSVSTNVVVIDAEGRLIEEIYTRTQGRPIEVVSEALRQIEADWGDRLTIRGSGTTGSGRELVGELIGADTINDEITCHKTGATYVGRTMLDGRVPDTIFEIGGQDSKYISLSDGVVVDFTMNEACAAGTGSFLEERAEELDISIKGEFADLALSSDAPIRLGERCTVFMERDVNSYLHRGAEKNDLVAGLAYSVVYNYINRVVRGRKIGETIFFQGGTAYNDAVAAAFAAVTGKEIIVPPHNGVVGAIGAALLARDRMNAPAAQASQTSPDAIGEYVSDLDQAAAELPAPRFRGYDTSQVDYALREFTCHGCSNACQIQEFTVAGEKTYWGDKCSDRFRKTAKADTKPVIDDLPALREKLLLDESPLPALDADAPTVGIPLTMFAWEQLPFWRTLLAELGLRTVLSDPTNKKIIQAGLDTVVAEPCFPIIVAHGHVANLAGKDVDYILTPNILSQETPWMHTESHLCPWHQTLAFVCRQAPKLRHLGERFLTPNVAFREGRKLVHRHLARYFRDCPLTGRMRWAKRDIARAVDAAFAAQDRFAAALTEAGDQALTELDASGRPGIVVVGRPYNIHDAGMNLSVMTKLREQYGVNVIPIDFLPVQDEDIRDINEQMYWNLGHRIIAAAKIVGRRPNLHIIYITNFKCGPDSFIKHFIKTASGKPFLSLQFDGHSNDAGMMTRCEAYLDSKGILRPWRDHPLPAAAE